MDILTAILACSLYADDGLVRAIVQSTSASNPYEVIDAAAAEWIDEAPPPPPRTLEDALRRMNEIAERGGTPLLGLMQIPPSWAVLFGREARDLFDPCINISIGTARLSEFDRTCAAEPKPKPARRRKGVPRKAKPSALENRPCIVHQYADAIGMHEFLAVTTLELDHQKSTALVSRAREGGIFYLAEPERSWGNDRIFFQARAEEISAAAPPGGAPNDQRTEAIAAPK